MQNITGKISKKLPLTGGDINDVFLLVAQKGRFVVKRNSSVPDDFFEKEARGLGLLKQNGLSVPEVFYYDKNTILMEYLEPGPQDPETAGRKLALLHQQPQKHYGLSEDNYIGSLKQANGICKNWSGFFINKRILPQLQLYFNETSGPDSNVWERLFLFIENNLKPDFVSLLHGDIWSGNLYYSQSGPVYIDPSVYYGDYRVDLSFTELFGGFSKPFYEAYNEINHLDSNYYELKGLYQIYPLLVHANLFGGSYYSSALERAKKYIL